jgi:hypothetical protein
VKGSSNPSTNFARGRVELNQTVASIQDLDCVPV